jgi:hypothetical protein
MHLDGFRPKMRTYAPAELHSVRLKTDRASPGFKVQCSELSSTSFFGHIGEPLVVLDHQLEGPPGLRLLQWSSSTALPGFGSASI